MILQTVWKEETLVRAFETDLQKRWKPSAFFHALQEAAANHAEHLGVGYQEMFSRDMVWILSRLKIQFHEFPLLGDKITVQTWPKGLQQKLFFMRDFHLTAKDGRRFASASTAWLLVNIKARRLLMPTALYKPVPDNNGLAALTEPLEKLNVPEGLPERLTIQAGYSAIDLMEHANNARYADWVCDCFPIEEWRRRTLDWMQVNYINEVRPGERVVLGACQQDGDPNTWLVSGTNQTTGLRAFEAALRWK